MVGVKRQGKQGCAGLLESQRRTQSGYTGVGELGEGRAKVLFCFFFILHIYFPCPSRLGVLVSSTRDRPQPLSPIYLLDLDLGGKGGGPAGEGGKIP
jgi:hypothetical protein